MIDYRDVFHVGIRVHDLEAEMRSVGDALDVSWAQLSDRGQQCWTPATGATEVNLRVTYSTEGPQRIELLQGEPGSLWDAGDELGPGLHHAGVFVESVAEAAEQLLGAGWTLLGANKSPEDGYGIFAYLRSPAGFILEPVDIARKPALERWWAGGSF